MRRVLSKRNEHVTSEGAGAGNGFGEDQAELFFVMRGKEKLLTQFQEHGAEFVLDLDAMEIGGNVNAGKDILAEKDAMVALHIEEFDGKDVGGGAQLVFREEKRRRFELLVGPPVDGGRDAIELGCGKRDEGAHDVEIGLAFAVFAARGGAIEKDGFEIRAGGILEAADESGEFGFDWLHKSCIASVRGSLPAAAGAAASAAATAKTAKSTAAGPTAGAAAKTATAPAATARTGTHTPKEGPNPPAAAAAAPASAKQRRENEKQDNQPEDARAAAIARSAAGGTSGRLAGECDAVRVGDVLGQLPRGEFNGGAVIAGTEKRKHGAACIAGARIVDDRLKAVADFDTILAVVRSEKEEDAFVIFLAADAKLFIEIGGVLIDILPVERADGDDGHLDAGFVLEFRGESFETRGCGGVEDTCEIGDVARRVNSFDVVGARRKRNGE